MAPRTKSTKSTTRTRASAPASDPFPRPTQASSLEDLDRMAEGVLGTAPSGLVYRLNHMNLTRFTMCGGLPQHVAAVALQSQSLNEAFEKIALARDGGTEAEKKEAREQLEFFDRVCIASIREPAGLTVADLGDPTDLSSGGRIPGIDYRWICAVAFRLTDEDAEGRRLWGVEPLDTFRVHAHFHGCDEDCAGCFGARLALSGSGAG